MQLVPDVSLALAHGDVVCDLGLERARLEFRLLLQLLPAGRNGKREAQQRPCGEAPHPNPPQLVADLRLLSVLVQAVPHVAVGRRGRLAEQLGHEGALVQLGLVALCAHLGDLLGLALPFGMQAVPQGFADGRHRRSKHGGERQ